MFEKKYLFETTYTRKGRKFKKFLALIVVLFIGYVASAVFILMDANKLNEEASYLKELDLLVIFTGDKGRIAEGIQLAKSYNQENVLISGVYHKNTVNRIITTNELDFVSNNLDIDYTAQNTVENVLSTLSFLRDNDHFKKVLIISSDYHLLRIKMIFDFLKRDPTINLYYQGTKTDFKNTTNLKTLFIEVYKCLRTLVFLMVWPSDYLDYDF